MTIRIVPLSLALVAALAASQASFAASPAKPGDAAQALPLDRLAALHAKAAAHRTSGEVGRRWLSLEDQISRRQFMGA